MVSLFSLLLHPACPACRQGRLFRGFITIADRCERCGLALKEHEKGDGPAFFAITLVGFVVTFAAFAVELRYAPPYWVHVALWGPMIFLLSVYCLRVFKALLIHWQYRVHPGDFGGP